MNKSSFAALCGIGFFVLLAMGYGMEAIRMGTIRKVLVERDAAIVEMDKRIDNLEGAFKALSRTNWYFAGGLSGTRQACASSEPNGNGVRVWFELPDAYAMGDIHEDGGYTRSNDILSVHRNLVRVNDRVSFRLPQDLPQGDPYRRTFGGLIEVYIE